MRHVHSLHRRLTASAAALALLPAAASADSINVFNWSDYIAPDTLERFTAATGISVTYDVFDSNDTLQARLLAGASGFDVVVPTDFAMQRQIAAGLHQPLNPDLLPNLVHMDPDLMALVAVFDPDNAHGVIYKWGTTGLGYNVAAVAERLGEDYEVNSWSILFDPEKAALFEDCGIAMLDSATDMLPPAMNFLGLDPNATDEAGFTAAADLLLSVRPFVRYFHSSQYITDLANGEICLAVGWSGDVLQAAERAEDAGRGVEVGYAIPNEGAALWFDMLVIPADAPNPEGAHAFINFLMDPEIAAANTNYVMYPTANASALEFVEPEILEDTTIFPTPEAKAGLWTLQPWSQAADRNATRTWTRVRTGQ